MRLSIWASSHQSWSELLALANHAEVTGWDGVWLADRTGAGVDAWVALGALATAVPRIRLGSLVSSPAERHPAVLAKHAVTVDRLSGGRAVLGLGAGRGSGPVAERLSRLEEACQVVRSLLDRPRTTFQGRHFQLEDAPLEPKALGPLPLLIGGQGERVTLRIAARWADEWNGWGDVASIGHRLDVLNQHCAAVGRDPSDVRRSAQALVMVNGRSGQHNLDLPRVKVGDVAGYGEAGIDEFIVPDLTLGRGDARLAAMDTIRSAAG